MNNLDDDKDAYTRLYMRRLMMEEQDIRNLRVNIKNKVSEYIAEKLSNKKYNLK